MSPTPESSHRSRDELLGAIVAEGRRRVARRRRWMSTIAAASVVTLAGAVGVGAVAERADEPNVAGRPLTTSTTSSVARSAVSAGSPNPTAPTRTAASTDATATQPPSQPDDIEADLAAI